MNRKITNKVMDKLMQNIFLAVFICTYLYFILLGIRKIEKEVLFIDLAFFSICFLAGAIILLERGYKKSDEWIFLHGVECIAVGFITLIIRYTYLTNLHIELLIYGLVVGTLIYYGSKLLIIYLRCKKKIDKKSNELKETKKGKDNKKIEKKTKETTKNKSEAKVETKAETKTKNKDKKEENKKNQEKKEIKSKYDSIEKEPVKGTKKSEKEKQSGENTKTKKETKK